MRFCKLCENWLYPQLDEESRMVLCCKNCSFSMHPESDEDACISHTSGDAAGSTDYRRLMNADIAHDPTLPRVRHIKCANASCPSTDANREVIYLKYDPVALKFLYHCCTCQAFWLGANAVSLETK